MVTKPEKYSLREHQPIWGHGSDCPPQAKADGGGAAAAGPSQQQKEMVELPEWAAQRGLTLAALW